MYTYPSKKNFARLKAQKVGYSLFFYFLYLMFVNYVVLGLVGKGHVTSMLESNLHNRIEMVDFVLNVLTSFVVIKALGYRRFKDGFQDLVRILAMFVVPIAIFRLVINVPIVLSLLLLDGSRDQVNLIISVVTMIVNIFSTYILVYLLIKKLDLVGRKATDKIQG